jgi:ATP-dependent exoDNAse (exonuclease V) beta subunit
MNPLLPDETERLRALQEHESTLMVEAGAGTGKTSLLAGRIILLLVAGIKPENIAAITYTELAASELMQRIREYAAALLDRNIPEPLRGALPKGLDHVQQINLQAAVAGFDQLTCTTIHGFCQRLIIPYPIEANVDPGASPMDEQEADLLAENSLRRWLRAALDTPGALENPIAQFLLELPDKAEKLLTSYSLAKLKYRNAVLVPPSPLEPCLQRLLAVIEQFSSWYKELADAGLEEESTAVIIHCLLQLSAHYSTTKEPKTFQTLWSFAHPPRVTCMKSTSLKFGAYQCKTKWKKACKRAGRLAMDADICNEEASELYFEVDAALQDLVTCVAGHLVGIIFDALNPFQTIYQQRKRVSAALDFDDLLYFARDLLREHPEVRKALADKYRFVLVDEFQDTDPIQCEILFLMCSRDAHDRWDQLHLRPGQLFLVGDPKQSIYRFRGADIHGYTRAKNAVKRDFPKNILQITANFRSRSGIIDFVNDRFKLAFGQLGYEPLTCTVASDNGEKVSVARLDVGTPQDEYTADERREREAEEVAMLCQQLIGSYRVRRKDEMTPCRPGDIALLTPAGTGLWTYERALENADIPIATQAGKGFFVRQEVHDMLAIARILSNNRDTLALGAFLRGPLIGLTEQQLLDILVSLPTGDYKTARLALWTNPSDVHNPLASNTLRILQSLARHAYNTSPFDVLSEAAGVLRVRPVLAQRHPRYFDRAISNVELFLEMSKPYATRGMRAFAEDMMRLWEEEERELEGRADVTHEAVHLITIHSAKGLEWPVIIPINMATGIKSVQGVIYNPADNILHCAIGSLQPTSYVLGKEFEVTEQAAERVRMRYVAATRARDLIVFPQHFGELNNCWYNELDLRIDGLPVIECESDGGRPIVEPPITNQQSSEVFIKEDEKVAKCTTQVRWHQPSKAEPEEFEDVEPEDDIVVEVQKYEVRGSASRGLILHKLM